MTEKLQEDAALPAAAAAREKAAEMPITSTGPRALLDAAFAAFLTGYLWLLSCGTCTSTTRPSALYRWHRPVPGG